MEIIIGAGAGALLIAFLLGLGIGHHQGTRYAEKKFARQEWKRLRREARAAQSAAPDKMINRLQFWRHRS